MDDGKQVADGGIASLRYWNRFGRSTLSSRLRGSSRDLVGYFAVLQFSAQSRFGLRNVRSSYSVICHLSSVFCPLRELRGLNLTALQDLAPGADDDFFHGNRDAGQFHTLFDNHGECRAAWNFHDHIGDAFNAGDFANL